MVGFVEGAHEDAFVGAVLKEAHETVSSFRFGETFVSGVVDPKNACTRDDADRETESPCCVVSLAAEGNVCGG